MYGTIPETEEFYVNVPIGDDIRNYRFAKCPTVDIKGDRNDYCRDPQDAVTKVKVLEYGTYKGRECTKVVSFKIK